MNSYFEMCIEQGKHMLDIAPDIAAFHFSDAWNDAKERNNLEDLKIAENWLEKCKETKPEEKPPPDPPSSVPPV